MRYPFRGRPCRQAAARRRLRFEPLIGCAFFSSDCFAASGLGRAGVIYRQILHQLFKF
jgi:hypothetical protein